MSYRVWRDYDDSAHTLISDFQASKLGDNHLKQCKLLLKLFCNTLAALGN